MDDATTALLELLHDVMREHDLIRTRLEAIEAELQNVPPRCPRCGCYQFVYQGDRQVCADCGRE